jgi:hypothetical protein
VVKVRNLAIEWSPFTVPITRHTLAFCKNVRLSQMCLPGTNTLAYFAFLAVTKKEKCFVELTRGAVTLIYDSKYL